MNRREFLRCAGGTAGFLATSALPPLAARGGAERRTFDLTTRVEVLKPAGATRIWIPALLPVKSAYQETLLQRFTADGGTARLVVDQSAGLGVIAAEFPRGAKPIVTVQARITTRPYAVNSVGTAGPVTKASRASLQPFLSPTRLVPIDGIVKTTADAITKDAKTDVEKARAIYEWIVENTFRDPATRGCGVGDIRAMLEAKTLGGKCADLNALYVGLARAAGVPARDVYGVRVGSSRLGVKSLGLSSSVATKAQHCRAEVYLSAHGWVPVDPADVRKVVLEEPPGNLPMGDPIVRATRARLFGSWEMNWVAYNFAHDVRLPGSSSASLLGYLMYPQAETNDGLLDSLDPDGFKYEITSLELT